MLEGLLGPETNMGLRVLMSIVKQTLAGAALRHDANFPRSGSVEVMIGRSLLELPLRASTRELKMPKLLPKLASLSYT